MLEPPDDIFRGIFEAAPDAIVVTDDGGSIVLANPQAEKLLGYRPGELRGQSIENLVPVDRRATHARQRRRFEEAPQTRPMGRGLDLRACRRDGTTVPVDILLSPVDTEHGVMVIAVVRDMTDHRRAQEELEHIAEHDELTGVANRRRFELDLHAHLTHAARYGGGALLMVDVDNFKRFNDTYGHAAGDEVLRHVARSLTRRVRASDVVARVGGDEFAVLLPRASRAEAMLVAEDLVHGMRSKTVRLQDQEVRVTVSVGVTAIDPAAAASVEVVLASADLAMYAAKQHGRDQARTSEPAGRLGETEPAGS